MRFRGGGIYGHRDPSQHAISSEIFGVCHIEDVEMDQAAEQGDELATLENDNEQDGDGDHTTNEEDIHSTSDSDYDMDSLDSDSE